METTIICCKCDTVIGVFDVQFAHQFGPFFCMECAEKEMEVDDCEFEYENF